VNTVLSKKHRRALRIGVRVTASTAAALVAAAAVAAPQSFWPFQPALMALLLSPPAVPLLETPTVLFCPVPAARPATVLLSWIGCVTFG